MNTIRFSKSEQVGNLILLQTVLHWVTGKQKERNKDSNKEQT